MPKPSSTSPQMRALQAGPPQPAGIAPIAPEAIADRAYQRFVQRGYAHGFDREDWAEAERELTMEALRESSDGDPTAARARDGDRTVAQAPSSMNAS